MFLLGFVVSLGVAVAIGGWRENSLGDAAYSASGLTIGSVVGIYLRRLVGIYLRRPIAR